MCQYKFNHCLMIAILLTLSMQIVVGQPTTTQEQVQDIVVIRQKLYKKKKNEPFSCNELKADVKRLILGPDINVKDLDPLTEAVLDKYLKCPQTEWESVLERSQVELYKSQLLRGVEKLKIDLPKNIRWSPLKCPCFDASATDLGMATNTESLKGFWLIEINNSIEISVGEYAKIAALVTPIKESGDQVIIDADPKAYEDVLSQNKSIFKHFINRLVGHMVNDPVFEGSSILIGKPYLTLYAQYSINAQIFALAHELSHVILKHNFTTKGLVSEDNTSAVRLNVSSFTEGLTKATSYRQEYAADSLGLEIMLAVIESTPPDTGTNPSDTKLKGQVFGIYGAEMLLTWIELFQQAEIATYGVYPGADTHPPGSERRKRIRRLLQRKSLLVQGRDYGLSTYTAMNIMWEKLKPEWINSLSPKMKNIKIKNECRHTD